MKTAGPDISQTKTWFTFTLLAAVLVTVTWLYCAPEYAEGLKERYGRAIVVSGRLLHGGVPFGNAVLQFTQAGSGPSVANPTTATTAADGAFSVRLPGRGDYALEVKALPLLSATYVYATFTKEYNAYELDLPPTDLTIALELDRGEYLTEAIQLVIIGPAAPTDFERAGVVRPQESPLRLRGIGFGDYLITASTKGGLVSGHAGRVKLSPDAPIGSVRLQMQRRPLQLRVQGPDGKALLSASVAATRQQIQGSDGTFDVSATPPGEQIHVSANGFVPVCKVAGYSDESVQMQKLSENVATFVLTPAPAVPMGAISGVPGSTCDVPVSSLPSAQSLVNGDLVLLIKGLPDGVYGYRADPLAPYASLVIPGPELRYTIPVRCLMCAKYAQVN